MSKAASESEKLAYRVKNWSKYNEALVNRGDITFWFDEAVIDAWEHENDQKKVAARSPTATWRSRRY